MYIMPVDFNVLGKEGKQLFREWKEKVKKHNSYSVKNEYHKRQKMDLWNKELNQMNEKYRKAIKKEEIKTKEAMKELEKMRKEEELLLKIAEQKKKEAAAVKRRLNKEKRKLELSKIVPRRSRRLLNKTKRSRCPNGTRKNKKTGNCEKKTKK